MKSIVFFVTLLGMMSIVGLAGAEDIAFIHAEVVPMTHEGILSDQTVIVRDNCIDEIGPSSEVIIPARVTRIDATGLFLTPALADMHVHVEGEAWNALLPPDRRYPPEALDQGRFLFPYVANGIATIAVMSATIDHIELRDRIDAGEILGPRMILGHMIDGPGRAWPEPLSRWVATPEEARKAVCDFHAAGYDFVKTYSFLSKDCYDAVIEAAKETGMPVDGHVPVDLSVEYVIEAGQRQIVHSEEIAKHAVGEFSQQQIDAYTDLIAGSTTWMTPTLVETRQVLSIFDDLERQFARPEMKYIHPMILDIWSYLIDSLYAPIPATAWAEISRGFESFQKPLTTALLERGVPMMAGSDALVPTLIPGFALHDELEELVGIGMTPYQALASSTTRPFEFLGESDVAGTIEVGKRADLLLLEANPLADITHTRSMAGVMIRGRWLSRTATNEGLADVAEFYRTLTRPSSAEVEKR